MKRSPSSVKRNEKKEQYNESLKASEFHHQIAMFLRSSANDQDMRASMKRRSAVANARLLGVESLTNALRYLVQHAARFGLKIHLGIKNPTTEEIMDIRVLD